MTDPLPEIPVLERTIPSMLDRQVAMRPDHPAIVDDQDRSLTYGELQQQARRVASGLAAIGVRRHEPVLVMLDNHIDHVLVCFAAAEAAMVEVPINTAFKGDMLAHVVRQAEASVLVIEDSYLDRLHAVGASAPALKKIVVRGS